MIRSTIPIGYLARLVAFGWENVVYFARLAVGMCILVAQCVAQVVMLASASETGHPTYAQASLRREIFRLDNDGDGGAKFLHRGRRRQFCHQTIWDGRILQDGIFTVVDGVDKA